MKLQAVSNYRFFVIFMVALLTACNSNVMKPQARSEMPKTSTVKPAEPAKLPTTDISQIKEPNIAPPVASQGGYYKDDGPGENPPNIAAIPNPTPKPEVPITRANKPYRALGQSYRPMNSYEPYKMLGKASWYGKRFHGQKTASGEIYNMYAMTAAHTILPLPSYAKVTNPENGKSVIVRVNDRGPFHSDRLVDLSYAAAYKLGIVAKGSSLVEIEAIDTRRGADNPLSIVTPQALEASSTNVESAPKAGIYLQAGAFKKRENADKLSQKIILQNLDLNVAMQTWYNAGSHRVWLGPFSTKQDALTVAPKLKPATGKFPLVVTQP